MEINVHVQRFRVHAIPSAKNPQYSIWQSATICLIFAENDRLVAVQKARSELAKRHWQIIEFEDKSTLIESLVRDEGGLILKAFEEARAGRTYFVVLESRGRHAKSDLIAPRRIDEPFMDRVIARAGGQRIAIADIPPSVRIADYEIAGYIFELKDLQEEALLKPTHQKKLAALFEPHRDAGETVVLDPSVLSHGEWLRYLDILGAPLQTCVKSAAKQIKSTKKFLNQEEKSGGLIVLNTGLGTFPHDLMLQQATRYATKDTREIAAVIVIETWMTTNGFSTDFGRTLDSNMPSVSAVRAILDAFDELYMEMTTQMFFAESQSESQKAAPTVTVAFTLEGVDYVWPSAAPPLPWEKEA